ncbi:hypothetical protein [Sphingomonas sp. Leaf4]|uniref:hypothetical protein n=1 Tax=Sphingomonas sp. Leaf4 TaxID=2876553 RepID=UPI001E49E2AC|nr:hypothetical protein [Sphingomonas sp. Leaf4]
MVNIGTVWDRTVDFVRDHLGSVTAVVLATQFAPSVVSGSLERLRGEATGGMAAVYGIVTLAATLIALWGALYLIGYAAQTTGREQAAEARRIATGRFLPLIGVSLILLVGFFILALPGIVLGATSGFDFVAAMNGTTLTPEQYGALGPAILYFALLTLVAIWVFARLLTVNAVVAMERRGLGAIARGFAMTKGMALKLIGLLILYGIITGVAVSAARFVTGAIFAIFTTPGSGIGIGDVAVAVATAAVSAVLALYQAVFIGKLYRAIVGEKDDADVFA